MNFDTLEDYYPQVDNAYEFLLGREVYELEDEKILTPNAMHGHKRAIYKYLQEMLRTIDHHQCYDDGCDWVRCTESLNEFISIISVLTYYQLLLLYHSGCSQLLVVF